MSDSEQASSALDQMTPNYRIERALFVVGEPDSGKSKQLRSMFRDVRLHTNGVVPSSPNLTEIYRLSNERRLYLRLMSPHEAKESIKQDKDASDNFLDKTAKKITTNPNLGTRWNFACPLQPNAANYMPNVVDTCEAFVARFKPERTRVVFLSPDRHGKSLQEAAHISLVDDLHKLAIPSIELCWIDARDMTANGLLLADFFDFT